MRRLFGRRGGFGRGDEGEGQKHCPLWDSIRGVWNQGVGGANSLFVYTFIPAYPRRRTRHAAPAAMARVIRDRGRKGAGGTRGTWRKGWALRPPKTRAIPARAPDRLQAIALGAFSLRPLAAPLIDPAALCAARFFLAGGMIGAAALATEGLPRSAAKAPCSHGLLGGVLAISFVAMLDGLKSAPRSRRPQSLP